MQFSYFESQALQTIPEKLTEGSKAIVSAIAELTLAIKETKQKEVIAPAKSNTFLYTSAGFLLLATAVGAYYYREKIKQTTLTDVQTQTDFFAESTTEQKNIAPETNKQNIQSTTTESFTSTETPKSNALPPANEAGLFSNRTTTNSSPINVSLENSPTLTLNAQTTAQQGSWFNPLAWGRN